MIDAVGPAASQHSDIADHLGLSMETVSRAFSTLKNRGDIALNGANFFRPVTARHDTDLAQAA